MAYKALKAKEVRVLSGLFGHRMKLNRDYLNELDTTCLLQNYYLESGVIMPGVQVVNDPTAVKLHWGWESPTCQLRGHFLGHWLSACALLVESEGDRELEVKVNYVVSELLRLQKLNEEGGSSHGWVAPIPEKYFDILMTDRYIWSPQYTMHKLLMGLTDVYERLGNKEALTVLDGLADWYLSWTEKVTKYAEEHGTQNAVFAGEQAGMLEIWARLFALTDDRRYMELADRYAGNSLFEILDKGGDPLTDNHTNASIPLAHGAAAMYDITGDEKWLNRVEAFWKKAVTERGMYATTGNNSGEFWIPPGKQGTFISSTDQEFCTVYNMVRVASWLLGVTGKREYADYIERAVYNGFLAQQSAQSGMPAYFLPMLAGSKKKWGSKRNDFWCCTGTMVQAQTLYPELIYLTDESNKTVYVSQYIPSEATFKSGDTDILIRQDTGMKNYSNQAFFDERGEGAVSRWALNFDVEIKGAGFDMALRVPDWSAGLPTVAVNDKTLADNETGAQIKEGWLIIKLPKGKNRISLLLDSRIAAEPLSDEPERAAIVSGPIVLAGLTDKDAPLICDDVRDILKKRVTHTYSTFPWEQDHYVTCGQYENIEFRPLYEVENEAYTIYFNFKNKKGD
ncbi:MAG: glycoside hydrolase family 127 protein [Lachnospiraceae bacterium]|nr:glycoside hydrolase family 127 protein [Lachnospiraceae bacterium]